jgi:hypothetical protein
MIDIKNIPEHKERLMKVVDLSWCLLKAQFIKKRYEILKEAAFQHHFAVILSQVGNLFCFESEDFFRINLESRTDFSTGKTKNIDITCEFVGKAKCAIELKFKTKKQAAQDIGRINMYKDIEALENTLAHGFDMGYFYMLTDSSNYYNESKSKVGKKLCVHNGYESNEDFSVSNLTVKGRGNVDVKLNNSYKFNWEKSYGWYFLAINVK